MRLELYDDITMLFRSEEKDIILVQHMIKNLFYVKKIIRTQRDIHLYEELCLYPHNNLANVMEYSNTHDKTIVIEEFVNGCTLEYKLSQRKLSLKEIYHIMMQLFSVVGHLHELSPPIIHRDIKPDNILIDKDKVYLIDFEIAKILDGKQRDLRIIGSVGYAAPEQYHGYSNQHSDIYSLGALLKEILDMSTIINKALFIDVINTCLCSNPTKRFENIRALKLAFLKAYEKEFKVCRKHTK